MARRMGSLATERTDYSDKLLFPGATIPVPDPFVRLEDFLFTSYNALLPPTTTMVALIDPSRRGDDAPQLLDETTSVMLETELSHCVASKPLADREVAGASLRLAVLWGRFSDLAATHEQADRAAAMEAHHYQEGIRNLFLEHDPNFATFGYHYGWSATLILERFAEAAGMRPVAHAAWTLAASAQQHAADHAGDRRTRRAHEQMRNIDNAHAEAVNMVRSARPQNLVGHGEILRSLQGHRRSGQSQRHI